MISKSKPKIKYLLKGLLLAFIISTISILIFTLLLRFTSLSVSKRQVFNYLALVISVFIAGIYVAIKIKEKGWIHGGVIGLGYFLVMLILNLVFFREVNSMLMISRFVISSVSGIIGGMVGINLV